MALCFPAVFSALQKEARSVLPSQDAGGTAVSYILLCRKITVHTVHQLRENSKTLSGYPDSAVLVSENLFRIQNGRSGSIMTVNISVRSCSSGGGSYGNSESEYCGSENSESVVFSSVFSGGGAF